MLGMLAHDQSAWGRDSSRTLLSDGVFRVAARARTVTLATPAPLLAAVDAGDAMKAKLQWQNITAETGYIVERKPQALASFTEVAKLPSDNVTYTDTTTAAQTYAYRVRAYRVYKGKIYYSEYSNAVTLTTATSDTGCP